MEGIPVIDEETDDEHTRNSPKHLETTMRDIDDENVSPSSPGLGRQYLEASRQLMDRAATQERIFQTRRQMEMERHILILQEKKEKRQQGKKSDTLEVVGAGAEFDSADSDDDVDDDDVDEDYNGSYDYSYDDEDENDSEIEEAQGQDYEQQMGTKTDNAKSQNEAPRKRSLKEFVCCCRRSNKVGHVGEITSQMGITPLPTEVTIEELMENLDSKTEKHILKYINRSKKENGKEVILNDFTTEQRKTLLNHAISHGFYMLTEILLQNYKEELVQVQENEETELEKALHRSKKEKEVEEIFYDDIVALLVKKMKKRRVLQLFRNGKNCSKPKLQLRDYLDPSRYEKTILAILDCMMQHTSRGTVIVQYDILEADSNGLPPTINKESTFQTIAVDGHQPFICHEVVRALIKYKWTTFARKTFISKSFFFFIPVIMLTFCAVTSVIADDVKTYDSAVHYIRAVCEVAFYINAWIKLISEVTEIIQNKWKYFKDVYNYFELLSALAFVSILPVRYASTKAHWYLFSVGYLLWVLQILKYAVVIRSVGVFAQVMWHVMTKDAVQFGILFLVINLAFSGSFMLALKGDGCLEVHDETSTFWGIVFIGLRTVIEGEPIVEYTGDDGYRPASAILMILFLFMIIVIMLNLFIAQLTNTYQKVADDANCRLQVNLARIIRRVEIDEWGALMERFGCKKKDTSEDIRSKNYIAREEIQKRQKMK